MLLNLTINSSGQTGTQTVTMGSIQFTTDGSFTDAGLDPLGKAYVVLPSGTGQITSVTPAQTGSGASLRNGLMLNPTIDPGVTDPDVGFDGRLGTFNAASNQTLPVTVSSGDVLVKVISESTLVNREGNFTEMATLHVVSSAPGANECLGCSMNWPGKSSPEAFQTVDLNSWYATRPVYSSVGIDFPTYDDLMASLGKYWPTFAFVRAPNGTGYENISPYRFGGDSNYGDIICRMMAVAGLALISDIYTEAQTKEIYRMLVRFGLEAADPSLKYSSLTLDSDGGHFNFHQLATVLMLDAFGRNSEIPDIMTKCPGNWGQAFEITPDVLAKLVPHDNSAESVMWRRRTLPTQTGTSTQVTISAEPAKNDNAQLHIPREGKIVREANPVSGSVVAEATATLDIDFETNQDTQVNLTGPSPFSAGDVIYFEDPDEWAAPGKFDWAVRGFNTANSWDYAFTLAAENAYRNNNAWTGQLLTVKALGLLDPTMRAVEGFVVRANSATEPSSANNYPGMTGGWTDRFGGIHTANNNFWNTHWSAIEGTTPSGSTNTTVTATYAMTPGLSSPGTMLDGVVIGLKPGKTNAFVEIGGTATGDVDFLEARILRQSDSSVVQDWTTFAKSGATWKGYLELPKADEWWKAEVRPVRNTSSTSTITQKFAVGYKMLLLGQSQMSICTNSTGATFTMTAAYEDTASFYEWQAYNLNGIGPVAESLSLIDNTSTDGLRSFVEQFRQHDANTPLMLVREAVNGTNILELTDDGASYDSRRWSDLTNKTNKYGGDFSSVIVNWTTKNASPLEGDEGVKILNGIDYTQTPNNATPDHDFTEVFQKTYGYAVSPGTRHSYQSTNGYRNEEVIEAQARGYAVGPPVSDYELGLGETAHPANAEDGNLRLGARLAVAAARNLGLDTSTNPYFSGTGTRSVDGTYIDVDVTLPNSGSLYSPATSNVWGFEVSENSGSTWSGISTGFTGSVVGNKVRLTKSSGTWAAASSLWVKHWTNGDDISEGTGVQNTTLEAQTVDGAIYETWTPDHLGLGLPIIGQDNAGVWECPGEVIISSISQA